MRTALWSFIGWGLCLIGTHSAQAANKSTKNFYTAAREELLKGARNCTRYIPDNWLQLMREIEPVDPTSGIQLSVPEDYLYSCLSNELKHKNDTSPFSYTSRNYITYNIALKEVVSLGFDGILAAQVSIQLQWNDTRAQWRKETGVGNWTFPTALWYPIREVWVPNFRLANCQSEKCVVKPQELKLLMLSNTGDVYYESEMMLQSTCDLDLTWFPLDDQNCTLEFVETEIPVCSRNMYKVNLKLDDNALALYMAQNDEWVVRYFGHYPHPRTIWSLKYWKHGKWNRTKIISSNLSFTVNVVLNRHPEYYIYNLIIPLLLVAFTGIASVFIPSQSETRLNMALTVVLTFIFLQTLVASMSPKTPKSPVLANYILWSLVLAVLHVCACAIMWKLATLTETKPWPVLQLLFVKCMRLAFWQQLFKCGSLFRTSSAPLAVNYHQANSSAANTPGTECLQLPGGHASDSSCNDEKITPTKVTTKAVGDGEEIDKEKLPVEKNEPNTWMEVSFGVNRLITVAYLLVNALAFAFYLCPLLYRIIRHYSVVDYVNDIGEYAI